MATLKISNGSDPPEVARGGPCCESVNLSVLCVILGVMVILFLWSVMSIFMVARSGVGNAEFCLDHHCTKASSEIHDFVDPDVDPCDDFYSFVCGGFMRNAHEKRTISPIDSHKDLIGHQLDALIFEEPLEDDSRHVGLQKSFFRACMGLEGIENDRDRKFLGLVRKLGGWPVRLGQKWREEEFHWLKLMVLARSLGVSFEWFLKIGIDKETPFNYIKISPPEHCADYEIVLHKKEYLRLMIDVAVNSTGSRVTAASEMSRVLAFEIELGQICRNAHTIIAQEKVVHTSISKLEESWPKMDWVSFLQDISQGEGSSSLNPNSTIALNVAEYISDLDALLIRTPKRVQANYIVWKIVTEFAPYLSKAIRARFEEYKRQIHAKNGSCNNTTSSSYDQRLQFCKEETRSRFPLVSEVAYIRKYLDPVTRDDVNNMVALLKDQLLRRIEGTEWLDDSTKENSFNVVSNISNIVAGEDVVFEEDQLSRILLIGELEFNSSNVVEMMTQAEKSHKDAAFGTIFQERPDLNEDYGVNVDRNVYLDSARNVIVLPASILSGFFYHKERPQYLNYAALGTVIAGSLALSLESHIHTSFQEVFKCLEHDYENYAASVGSSTDIRLVQKYAGFVSRDLAYDAYQRFVEEHGEEPKLLGLPYTPNQLFWIRSGSMWCYKDLVDFPGRGFEGRYDDVVMRYQTTGPLRSSRYFSRDFGCPSATNMNSEEKCQVL